MNEYKIYTAKTPNPVAKGKDIRAFQPLSEQSETELNSLLQDGWEVESTHTGTAGWMIFGNGYIWHMITFVLRRPV